MNNNKKHWLILLLCFSQMALGRTQATPMTLNFAAGQNHGYRYQYELQRINGEATVKVIEIYRDSTRLTRYETGGNCEFIGQVLIIDDPAIALKNYQSLSEETGRTFDREWLNAFQAPLRTGAFVKCWFCFGESVFFLSFE